MLVGISLEDDEDGPITSVTYAGAPLMRVGARSDKAKVEIWSLVAPAVGSGSVVVTFASQLEKRAGIGVVTFTGVDQTTPTRSFAGNDGQSGTASVTISSASDELAFAVVAAIEQEDGLPTPGSGVTELWDYLSNKFVGVGGTKAGAASVTMSWSLKKEKDWVAAGLSIIPTGGSGGSGSGPVCTTTTLPGGIDFKAISGSSDSNIIAVGKDGTAYQYDGTSWTIMSTPNGQDIEGVHMLADGTAYAIAETASDGGEVLYFNGTSWISFYTNSSIEFKDIWAYASNEIYVAGKDGALMFYNGSSWSNLRSAAGASTSNDFEAVWGNSTHVYAVDENGKIYIRNRSTGNWTSTSSCTSGGTDVDDAWADSSGNVYLADKENDRILRYDGSSCTSVASASDEPQGIHGSNATGEIYAVGKNGLILYYDGSSWVESTSSSGEDLEAVWVSSTGTPYYVGDNGTVTTCTPPVSSGPDHYRIEHSGTGLTCQRSDVAIRACADATCSSEFTDPVTLTLSPAGKWVGGDAASFSGGSATFQLRQTTPATLTLAISGESPAATNATSCYLGGSAGSCDVSFYESGFIFDVPDLTSCQTSPSVTIQAVRADATAETCVADGGFANTSKTVNFWISYVNPNSGTEQVALSGTNIATSSPGTGISLSFNGSATANFTANYPDAGQLQLDARYNGVGAEESGLVMLGTDSFVVRPVGLCIYSDDTNADCVSGNGSCSEFKKVDENFNLKIKGVCWESGGDFDFCSGNTTTQNFELNNISISHTLLAPTSAGSSAGSVGISSIDIVSTDNGEHVITDQSVSEVGVFTFTATPPIYFGSALPAATSVNIGRFTPDHFETSITNAGALENACSGFTYSGQRFGYNPLDRPIMSIVATDSSGNTTINYRDDFVKLIDPSTQISMPAVTNDSTALGADAVTPLALTWAPAASNLAANDDGTLTFSLGADQFTYTRNANALVDRFTSDVQLEIASIVDSDGIAATDLSRFFAPAGIEIRYGRLTLQNAYGPETLPLSLPLIAEYFNGISFVTNTLDNCSLYDSVNLGLSNFQDNLASGETTPAGNGTLLAGLGSGMNLSAPWVSAAQPNDGSVVLTLDLSSATGLNLEWLRPGGVDPTAKATFGIFKGNERLIYMRESVQ